MYRKQNKNMGRRGRRRALNSQRLQTTGAREGDGQINRSLATIPPMPRQQFPRSEVCVLKGIDAQAYAPAVAFTSYHYQTNSFNQINMTNPGDFSVSQIPYWAVCSAKYAYYRVLAYEVHFQITNLETYPVLFTAINSNTTITPTAVSMQVAAANAIYGFSTMLQASPSPYAVYTYHVRFPIQSIVGSRAQRVEHNYAALTTPTDPVDLTHMYLALTSTGGASVSHAYRIELKWEVEFYDAKVQLQ